MYGLPKDIDLSFLEHKKLLQVCIGSSNVILRFEDDLSISVETQIRRVRQNGEVSAHDDAPSTAKALAEFLACSITKATGSEDGTLRMQFSNGDSLEITDYSDQYESYTIQHHTKLIVV